MNTLPATSLAIVVGVFALVAYGVQLLKWLRVLQREHYLAGSVRRFYWRWATAGRRSFALARAAVIAAGAVVLLALGLGVEAAIVLVLYGLLFPSGLSIRGRTSPLAWTRRMRTLAAIVVVASGAVVGALVVVGHPWIGVVAVLAGVPLLVDLGAWLAAPLENTLAGRYVARARHRLDAVHPHVVAITGSFGKTSTKHHLAELLGGQLGVVPSPRSFNNRAGLARAINENLASDTSVFIAEMGTYGPGEIRAMCAWCPPEIAIVTAIGPVHLERMGTLDVIEQSKFEITERAGTVVLNIDDPRLAAWVEPLILSGKVVRTGATAGAADVVVSTVGERWRITVRGEVVGIAPPVVGIRESNLAVALAAALELGMTVTDLVGRLAHLTTVANRMVVATAPSGVMVIDDTFNANPTGARNALATLLSLPINGRRVVVTPGLVELGIEQGPENVALASAVAAADAELVIVGRTNEPALASGFGDAARHFAVRDGAVAWVRENLRIGDGVLYLNDLPDHYP